MTYFSMHILLSLAKSAGDALVCDTKSNKDADKLRINYATSGYHIWRADPWADGGDTGRARGRIFDFQCYGDSGTSHLAATPGFYDFVKIIPDQSCVKSFSAKSIKTINQYITERSGSNTDSVQESFEGSGGGFGVEFSASAKFSSSKSSEYSGIIKLFTEEKGEVMIASAKCYTHDVDVQESLRPKFDRGFIKMLQRVNDGARYFLLSTKH